MRQHPDALPRPIGKRPLPAVLAHELGHLASTDGKPHRRDEPSRAHTRAPSETARQDPEPARHTPPTAAAVIIRHKRPKRYWYRSTNPGPTHLRLPAVLRIDVVFAKGGLGLRVTSPSWGRYWREREYTADQVRGQPRPSRGARGLPRDPRPHPRPPRPLHLAHRTHPPPNRATHRQAPQHHPPSKHTAQGTSAPATSDTRPLTA